MAYKYFLTHVLSNEGKVMGAEDSKNRTKWVP